jgi:hypothetical protein
MSPELRKKFDALEDERIKRKEKVFEHIKYNMNSDRPSTRPPYYSIFVFFRGEGIDV